MNRLVAPLTILLAAMPVAGQILLDDPLNGSTIGTRSGGAFVSGGWQVTNQYDTIYWHVPTVPHGALEYQLRGLGTACSGGSGAKNELSHMYDWTFGNSDVNYGGGYRDGPHKQFIRKQCEAGKQNTLELLWVVPNPGNLFLEDDSSALSWDANTTYTFRSEWENTGGNSILRTYRNGQLIETQTLPGTWNPGGQSVRIAASPRRADEGAHVGAIYSNIKVYDLGCGSPPAAPTITSPAVNETVNTTIAFVQWNGTGDMYQVRVSTINDPASDAAWDSQPVGPEAGTYRNFTWTGSLNNGTYYAFVRVGNCDVWGPWSAGRPFTINTAHVPPGPNLVRIKGNSLCDNNGPFLALGATYMRGMYNCRNLRASHFEPDCAFLASKGFNYIRILTMVDWNGLEIAPKDLIGSAGQFAPAWPDYWQQFRDTIDIAYNHGLRTEVTIFAGAQYCMPSKADRIAHMNTLLSNLVGREHKIVHLEVANEAWQNGFPGSSGIADLREFCQYLTDRTTIPVAITAPQDDSVPGIHEMYGGTPADLVTLHFTRSIGTVEGGWLPVRDSYQTGLQDLPPISSNEPIGPGSSVNTENDPIKLCAAGFFAWTANVSAYVFHSRAGVFGWTGCCPTSGTEVRFATTPGVDSYQNLFAILPPDLPSWERNDGKTAASPFTNFANGQADKWWTEVGSPTSGCVRNISAIKGGEFVAAPVGILAGGLEVEARRPMTFLVYHPITGAVVYNVTLGAGDQFTFAQGPQAYVIRGVFNDVFVPTDEVTIDLGSPDLAVGMTHPQSADGNTTPVSIGGRDARRNTNASVDHFFYFGVSDAFAFAGSEPDVFVIADYYDTGTGQLTLEYDGAGGAYQNAGSFTLTNTNTWKTRSWHLSDAYFANRQNAGADLRISNGGVTTFLEPFSYANGNLSGKVHPASGSAWSGGTVGNIEVSAGQLKVSSSNTAEAANNVNTILDFPAVGPGADNLLVIKVNITASVASNGNVWKLHFQHFDGSTTTLMAEWDGQWDGARPRHEGASGGQFGDMGATGITSDLTDGGIADELRAQVNTATGQAQYFFNGALLGTVTHTAMIGKSVNRVSVQRQARPLDSLAPGTIHFDSFNVAPTGQPAAPLTFYIDTVRITTDVPAPPIIAAVSPNPDPVLNGTPYSRELTLEQGSPAPTWSVLQGPVGLTVDSNGLVSGWTPGAGVFGLIDIEVEAVNSEGSDTETWNVLVLSRTDFDMDGDTDLADFALMQRCFSGDAILYEPGCEATDLDADLDVDGFDFTAFLPCMQGTNQSSGC